MAALGRHMAVVVPGSGPMIAESIARWATPIRDCQAAGPAARWPQSGRNRNAVHPARRPEISMAHHRHTEKRGSPAQAVAFPPTGQGQSDGRDPAVLCAHTVDVKFDRAPHHDGAGDDVPRRRRCRARTRLVPRIDTAAAMCGGGHFVRMPSDPALCVQPRRSPQFFRCERKQAVVGKPPLPEADHRLDQVRHAERLTLIAAQRPPTGSSWGLRAGSTGAGSGTSIGGPGASTGSTVIRLDGPGRLLRKSAGPSRKGTATSQYRGTEMVEAISGSAVVRTSSIAAHDEGNIAGTQELMLRPSTPP